jgi:hypothetical protein
MLEHPIACRDGVSRWHGRVLEELKNSLLARPWARDLLLRGSLARGLDDGESDIDLVVTVADAAFAGALDDLRGTPPLSPPPHLPPWLDDLVRDFGGLGLVYLHVIDAHTWGQIDLYLLPQSRRDRLFDREFFVALSTCNRIAPSEAPTPDEVDAVRGRHAQRAARERENVVMGCYVALLLLRKRIVRGDRLQIFADTYAAAARVKDLVYRACSPDGMEYGWRDVERIASRSPDAALVMEVVSVFADRDVRNVADLTARVSGLHELVALLAPATWRAHGDALRGLGRYLLTCP